MATPIRKIDMQRWLWTAWIHGKKLGWQGGAGALLLLSALGMGLLLILPWTIEVAELRANAHQLRERTAQRQIVLENEDPRRQLSELYTMFGDSDSITAVLEAIYAAAAKNNLSLEQADYKLVEVKADTLQRYEISLPVHGSYTQIKHFAAQILTINPGLAIAGVSLSRNTAGDTGLDAKIQLLLYVRGKP